MLINFLYASCLVLLIFNDAESQFGPIPKHLLECYQDDLIILPMTMTTLIDIIRKIELSTEYVMDMRMVANTIMKRFWRDGIERDPNLFIGDGMIPYTTAGFQSYKYSIVYSGLLPETGGTFPNESLTIDERCTLHFMLSGSVDPWERGDERLVCKEATMNLRQRVSYETTGNVKSACPIEKGVIMTDGFGTINAGRLISAIAMALQPMQVTQLALIKDYNRTPPLKLDSTKMVDNLWAATICGDLAEIIVFQKPLTNNITFGPAGNWNNTYTPNDYYLSSDQYVIDCGCWQHTDAEIIGSIDGLVLASEAIKWSEIIYTLKLSQLLEMYYTNYGGDIAGQIHVCNRRNYFFNDLKSQHEIIMQQTLTFSEILAVIAPHSFVNDEQYIEENIGRVYKTFMDYTARMLWKGVSCPKFTAALPKLQLTVIYDSTWSPYYTLQFLRRLSSIVDVSHYGSNITVINGASGAIVVNSATTQADLFFQWKNFTDPSKEAKTTNLLEGFLTLKNIIDKVNNNNTNGISNIPSGIVTIVLAMSSSLTDHDYADILSILNSIKTECPDMTFFYITTKSNSRTFIKFSSIQRSEDDAVKITDTLNQDRILNGLDYITNIPRVLIPTPCNGSKTFMEVNFEEYITPELVYIYRIHPSYLCSGNKTVTLKIKNNEYGNIDVCISRESFANNLNHTTCQTVTNFDEIIFNVNNTMELPETYTNTLTTYKPIYLRMQGRRSIRKCTERDCRFPDQLRYTITINGLKCVKDLQVTCTSCQRQSEYCIIFISLFLYLFVNKYHWK